MALHIFVISNCSSHGREDLPSTVWYPSYLTLFERTLTSRQPKSSNAPEVYHSHGLELAKNLNDALLEASHRHDAPLAAALGQGFDKPHEGLQRRETNELILVDEEGEKPLARRLKWLWITAILLVLAAAAVGGGIGGALKHKAESASRGLSCSDCS